MHHGTDSTAGWLSSMLSGFGSAVLLVFLALALAGGRRLRRAGSPWPIGREIAFSVGCVVLLAASTAARSMGPTRPFAGHMLHHVLVGMVAPLLLVMGRPLTLLMRSLRLSPRRRLLRLTGSRLVAVVTWPPSAALVEAGGLWLLYRTGVFSSAARNRWLELAVEVHVLASGLLFALVLCQLDPVRRRYPTWLRVAVLVLAGAAHAVLAKSLFIAGPPDSAFAAEDLQLGGQLMYYGGDIVEIATAVVIAVAWYRAGGREVARQRRREFIR